MLCANHIVGHGEMAGLTRAYGWDATSLGPVEGWPETLLSSVNLMLACGFPCVIFWGPEMIQFYNDAYMPLMSEKHPTALGQAAEQCWGEAWHIIGPQLEAVLYGGETVFQENMLVPVIRNKRLQDVYWTYSFSPIYKRDATVGGLIIICQDKTSEIMAERDRKQAEEALRTERASLSELFQQAPIFIAVLRGPNHVYTMCNPAYQRIVGNRRIMGMALEEAIPEVKEQGYVALLDQVFQSGEALVFNDACVVFEMTAAAPREEKYMDFVYQPKLDLDGRVTGIIVLGVDVTERRRAERALMQAEKLAAVGRLASSIAHEINNPLESVTNLLYLAAHSAGVTAEVADYLEVAERELRRVSVIANQTLKFYKQTSRPGRAHCEEMFDSVLSIFQGRLANTQIRVEKRKRTTQPVLCFEGEIRQVLSNLIGNAIDAMLGRGGRLLLRSREGTDWSSGRRGLVFTVADEGEGIRGADLKRIFEPFFTTKGAGGNGLGLWVSQEIVERHTGVIRVRSSKRQGRSGTVFSLFLPFEVANREPDAVGTVQSG